MDKKTQKLILNFSGLKEGEHFFNYGVDAAFFKYFDDTNIKKGEVKVNIKLIKSLKLLSFKLELKGMVVVLCDRCLDDFYLPIHYNTELYVKFGQKYYEETDNIIIIPQSETKIDLSTYIYEFINLSLPYRKIHDDKGKGKTVCNPLMIEKLKTLSNISTSSDAIDTRWNKLKEIHNKIIN